MWSDAFLLGTVGVLTLWFVFFFSFFPPSVNNGNVKVRRNNQKEGEQEYLLSEVSLWLGILADIYVLHKMLW